MAGSKLGSDADTREFWDSAVSTRIMGIGRALPLQHHTTSSIDEERALMDAMDIIQSRCFEEEEALNRALNAIYEHLEHEEDTIAQSLAAIRSRRNLLVPVMRLPPEILSRIFIFHAQLQWWLFEAVLVSTHVCRRWRQIGLDCPGLWSHINYDDYPSEAWMATMIERSRSVPLSLVMIDQENTDSQEVGLALIASNMHRFSSLDLVISYDKSYSELFDKPTPLLQNLRISYGGSSPFAFPPEFLSGHTPNLRHLKLSTSAYIPWDSGLFANLVTLHVDKGMARNDLETDHTDAPSLEMLLSALTKMPGLEILHLHDCFWSSSAPPMMGYTRIDLTNLTELSMTSPLRSCTHFLRRVAVNATVRLELGCFQISKADLDEFFTVFPSQLHPPSPPIAQALEFTSHDHRTLGINLRTVEFADSLIATIRLISAPMWGTFHSNGMSHRDLTWACFAALASPHLRSFCISNNIFQWDVEAWRMLGRAAPDLQMLSLGTQAQSVEFCKALRLVDEQHLVPADCFLPTLSCLKFAVPYDHPIPVLGGDTTPLHEVLASYLSARARIGCSTPELVFAPQKAAPDGWPSLYQTS